MPCYAMLCYAMRCYSMLCYAMLCYAILCYTVKSMCHTVLCHTKPYYTIHNAVLCHTYYAVVQYGLSMGACWERRAAAIADAESPLSPSSSGGGS